MTDNTTRPTEPASTAEPDAARGLTRRTALRAGAVVGGGLALAHTATAADDPVTVTNCGPGDPSGSPSPGPSVLDAEPVTAPQFRNANGWAADPLKVCGAEGYDRGEFLYQDWVVDDYGANTDPTDNDPQPPTATTLAAPVGDIVYPTRDSTYRDNAADLLEFRCRIQGGTIRYRVTLNTLVKGSAPIIAIGIDRGSGKTQTDWGHGLGDLGAPVTDVVVVSADGATLNGNTNPVTASFDLSRNQIDIAVDLQPGQDAWTHYCVAGIHDGNGGFAQVQNQASETNPGGARAQDPPPVFNVAFRKEPIGSPHHWRDKAQADALAARDISAFGADIDFSALRSGVIDRSQAAPENLRAYVNRLFSSRISIGGQTTYAPNEEGVEDDGDDAVLTGRVQPYSVYVPEAYDPDDPGPLHVLPHSLGQSYNQYAGNPNMLDQLGEQRDALILMFEGRGPAGWWHDEAEFDLFEALNDFRNVPYAYDEDRVTLGGYSMGGYATYRLASLYPDLFAAGFEIVGPPDEDIFGGPTDEQVESQHNTLDVTDNIRHVPLMMWHGTNDELVPLPGPLNYEQDLRDHGYRHELNVFPGYDHFLFSIRDQWGPGRDFLKGRTVTRQPDRVTYRSKPTMAHAVSGSGFTLTYDHAYWLSDISVHEPDSDAGGLVDAISYADGYGEPVAEDYNGVGIDPDPHLVRGTSWQQPVNERAGNALELTLEGVSELTVWAAEAGLRLDAPLQLTVTTDVTATIHLVSGTHSRSVTAQPGTHTVQLSPCQGGSGREEGTTNGTTDPPVDLPISATGGTEPVR